MLTIGLATQVNRAINASVTYARDVDQFGREDLWRAAPLRGLGDCEDYALAKRQALLDAGTPSQALRLAICRTELQEVHAVLIVTTERGDLVLDNRHPEPMTRDQLPGYTWLAIEEMGRWSTVAD